MKLRLLCNLVLLAASFGACTPSFDADLPGVEITQRGVKVPAAPASPSGGEVAVSGRFTLSSSDAAWTKHMNRSVQVHRLIIAPGGALPSLDFIASAHVTVAPSSSPGNATTILDYEHTADAPVASVIQVDMPAPIDITTAWTADATVVELDVAGQLPVEDWTIDVTLELSGKIAYKY